MLDLPPPPLSVDDGPGGDSGWTPLVDAPNDIEAHLLIGRLAEEGIETRAIKDRKGPAWMHGGSNPWAPVAIWVRTFQLHDSQVVLAELAFNGPDATRPEPTSRRSLIVWWTAAIALGLLLTGIGLARSADYLERCGMTADCDRGPVTSRE